jgi:hypothetical protein
MKCEEKTFYHYTMMTKEEKISFFLLLKDLSVQKTFWTLLEAIFQPETML